MTTKANVTIKGRNPDVLTCIANLSNDLVFTPPEFATQMLDTLADAWAASNDGASIWSNPNVKFLDPFTKSGVFLREIVSRLTVGLAEEIQDIEARVDHILSTQVFGIGVTELTVQLARRSVYCSKHANGEHSIGKRVFRTKQGNLWFERTEHTWVGGSKAAPTLDADGDEIYSMSGAKCMFCGANKSSLGREKEAETHAPPFIHTSNISDLVAKEFGEDMQFDVIIGNPPYHLNDGGGEGSSAISIYQHFVNQAKKLDPKYLTMVIPARWYSGGKGLDEFRQQMLGSGGMLQIDDFAETDLVFPGQNIRGGICAFVWQKGWMGMTRVVNHRRGQEASVSYRRLLEPGVESFIRHNEAVSIVSKVMRQGLDNFGNRVQSRNPFGIPSNFSEYSTSKNEQTPILLFRSRRGAKDEREVFIAPRQIAANQEFCEKIKVLVSKASPGGDEYPHSVFSQPIISGPGSVSTETYLIVDFAQSISEAQNLVTYMKTRFFRFLVSLVKNTQNISKSSFVFVPVLDMSRSWSDADLYEMFDISSEEQEFIARMIRPMDLEDAENA